MGLTAVLTSYGTPQRSQQDPNPGGSEYNFNMLPPLEFESRWGRC
ncbi:unnamed protein product [Protopolystoma xenopodis]|uniref:Uncharacterized protein n=1 Tax=Protopolystoma xenopodis TaxID=117903 RepID=A0A3S5FD65_9PLAT|nr:unnamed protein product [Protopolystoma xenopodis]